MRLMAKEPNYEKLIIVRSLLRFRRNDCLVLDLILLEKLIMVLRGAYWN